MKIKTKYGEVIDLDIYRCRMEDFDRMGPDMSGLPRHWKELAVLDALEAILQKPKYVYDEDSSGERWAYEVELDGYNRCLDDIREISGVIVHEV